MAKKGNGKRIYICHTFYHIYVTLLKEFHLKHTQGDAYQKADIMLSTVYLDLPQIVGKMEKIQFFDNIYIFPEKDYVEFPRLVKCKKDRGMLLNMFQRMYFCKRLSKEQEKYVPIDLRPYDGNIWVYCDSDSIGYYLNGHHIHYHAMEDGLNCIKIADQAEYDNRGAFKLKLWMAAHNLIFIQDGHSKYCIDMEVNDLSVIDRKYYKYVEVNRQSLVDELSQDEKDVILNCFIDNIDILREVMHNDSGKRRALILTEHILKPEVRSRMFRDIIDTYCKDATVIIKPHPRDDYDYTSDFADAIVLNRHFPMEIMEFVDGIHFESVYAILTNLDGTYFADEKVNMGLEFLNKYAPKGQFDYVKNM